MNNIQTGNNSFNSINNNAEYNAHMKGGLEVPQPPPNLSNSFGWNSGGNTGNLSLGGLYGALPQVPLPVSASTATANATATSFWDMPKLTRVNGGPGSSGIINAAVVSSNMNVNNENTIMNDLMMNNSRLSWDSPNPNPNKGFSSFPTSSNDLMLPDNHQNTSFLAGFFPADNPNLMPNSFNRSGPPVPKLIYNVKVKFLFGFV